MLCPHTTFLSSCRPPAPTPGPALLRFLLLAHQRQLAAAWAGQTDQMPWDRACWTLNGLSWWKPSGTGGSLSWRTGSARLFQGPRGGICRPNPKGWSTQCLQETSVLVFQTPTPGSPILSHPTSNLEFCRMPDVLGDCQGQCVCRTVELRSRLEAEHPAACRI